MEDREPERERDGLWAVWPELEGRAQRAEAAAGSGDVEREGAGHGVFHKSSKKTYPAMEKFFETHLLGKKKKILEGL